MSTTGRMDKQITTFTKLNNTQQKEKKKKKLWNVQLHGGISKMLLKEAIAFT